MMLCFYDNPVNSLFGLQLPSKAPLVIGPSHRLTIHAHDGTRPGVDSTWTLTILSCTSNLASKRISGKFKALFIFCSFLFNRFDV